MYASRWSAHTVAMAVACGSATCSTSLSCTRSFSADSRWYAACSYMYDNESSNVCTESSDNENKSHS